MYKYILLILILIASLIWFAVLSFDEKLHVIACDVGQGDAILIQTKSDQILVDGGPDGKVLDCLGKYMPFWDREIELVVLTHWDKDHSGGLVDLFKRYKVKNILTNNLSDPKFSTETTTLLEDEVGSRGTSIIYPYNLPTIRLGMIYLDILHPNQNFSDKKSNNYSIVTMLKYGQFEALLTGDIEDKVSDLISENAKIQNVDYIKIPHHGSKNGISERLLQVVDPEIGVISVGVKNSFGHPHQEVLDLLNRYGVRVFRTDYGGDTEIQTDGKSIVAR